MSLRAAGFASLAIDSLTMPELLLTPIVFLVTAVLLVLALVLPEGTAMIKIVSLRGLACPAHPCLTPNLPQALNFDQ